MSSDEMLKKLRESGWVMIHEDFVQVFIDAMHQHSVIVKTMAEIEELRDGAMTDNMKLLSIRLSEIAFTLEDIMHKQQ